MAGKYLKKASHKGKKLIFCFELLMVCVNDGEKYGCDCVIPRGRYSNKGGIFCIFKITIFHTLMIIWVKGIDWPGCAYITLRSSYRPKRGITGNFLMAMFDVLMIVLLKYRDW